MKITEAIALEHATLLRVFDEVELVLPRLKSAGEVGRLAGILEGVLRTHAELEIEFAFVALDHALYHKRHLETLHQDHRELDTRFRQARKASTREGARGLLQGAMRASREHFRHEERDLFPLVERTLGLGVLSALGEAFKKKARKADAKRAKQTKM